MAVNLRYLVYGMLGFNIVVIFYLVIGVDQYRFNILQNASPSAFLEHYSESKNSYPEVWDLAPTVPYNQTLEWAEYLIQNDFSGYSVFVPQDDYCDRVAIWRKYFKPKLDSRGLPIKSDRITFSEYASGRLTRSAVQEKTTEPQLTYLGARQYGLDPKTDMFYVRKASWHNLFKIGQHFLCEGQMYSHIPASVHVGNKDTIIVLARDYSQHYKHREHCFDVWKFVPLTYDLSNRQECLDAMNELQAGINSDRVKWIKKKARGSHNARGIAVVTKQEAHRILKAYANGERCGHLRDKYILQYYIGNPLLLQGKKFDFRVYLLIAKTDPLIAFYADGFLRLSVGQYDAESTEVTSHLTNTKIASNLLEQDDDQVDPDLLEKQAWDYQQFEDYLVQQGRVQPGWMQNYLKPRMRENLAHLVRMWSPYFLKHPGAYEIFGVDYIIDDDFNLYILEINRSPAMSASTEKKRVQQAKIVGDVLDIEYAILYNADLDLVLEDTVFEWVIDGRKEAPERYVGLISDECV